MMGNLVILFQTLWLGTHPTPRCPPPTHPTAPDHPVVPPVSGQRLADPPKVPSMPLMKGAASPPLASQRGQISSGAEQSGSGP